MCFWLLIARRYAVVIPNDCHIRYENIEILNGRIKTHIVSGDRKRERETEDEGEWNHMMDRMKKLWQGKILFAHCVYITLHITNTRSRTYPALVNADKIFIRLNGEENSIGKNSMRECALYTIYYEFVSLFVQWKWKYIWIGVAAAGALDYVCFCYLDWFVA